MSGLLELAERVEALAGPDRELDAEIALAIGAVPDGAFRPCAATDAGTFGTNAYGFWTCGAYSASLDAALSLVPEGLLPVIDFRRPEAALYSNRGWELVAQSECALTAIGAICSAALRARATTPEKEG